MKQIYKIQPFYFIINNPYNSNNIDNALRDRLMKLIFHISNTKISKSNL